MLDDMFADDVCVLFIDLVFLFFSATIAADDRNVTIISKCSTSTSSMIIVFV